MTTVWPFSPRLGAAETLVWKTDVLQSRTTEDRIALRLPGQGFALKFLFTDAQMALADSLYRSNPYGEWMLPVWPERSFISGVLSADTAVNADTDADYRDGGQAVIWSGDADLTVIEIDTVGAGVLNLAQPVGADHATGVVAPLRTARAPGGMEILHLHHGVTDVSMPWIVQDLTEIAETPFTQYLGLDVMSDPAVVTKGQSGRLVHPVAMVDNGFAPAATEALRDVMRGRHSAYFIDATRANAWRRKKWLYSIYGKQKAFWLPTWGDDMDLSNPIAPSDIYITIEPGLPAASDYVGRHLMIWDGLDFYYRQVTSATLSGGKYRLYMTALGATITEARLSFLKKVRSDMDTVTFNHVDGQRAEVELQMVEVA